MKVFFVEIGFIGFNSKPNQLSKKNTKIILNKISN
jgi:hypothetical protein